MPRKSQEHNDVECVERWRLDRILEDVTLALLSTVAEPSAKRHSQAERAKQQAAEAAKAEAFHTSLVEAKIATYKAQIRGAFPGTAVQFEAAWPYKKVPSAMGWGVG